MKKRLYILCVLLACITGNTIYASTTYDTLTICYGQSVVINGTAYSNAGQYAVTYQPGDSLVIYTINVSQPYVSLGENISICERTFGMIKAQGSEGYYTWSTGAIADSIFIGVSGTYSVTVTDVNGCTASDAIQVVIHPNPTPVIEGIPNPVCVGSSDIILTGLPEGGTFIGDLLSGNIFLASQAGVGFYNVYYSYTDSFGCSAIANSYIEVAICTDASYYQFPFDIQIRANEISFSDEVSYTIYSVDGKVIMNGKTTNRILSIRELNSGLYLFSCVMDKFVWRKMFFHIQ